MEKIASTVLTRLTVNKDESAFSDAESEQLRLMLNVSVEELDIIVWGCSYIWDQAAFYNLSPTNLASQLQEHGMTEAIVNVFGAVWASMKPAFMTTLRDYTFGAPKVLKDVDWRLQLTISHQSLAKTKVCNSILNISLGDANEKDVCDDITLELSKSQLYELYKNLETIQSQLDQISK